MVTHIKDIDERYRKIAEASKSNAPYYSFVKELVQGQGNREQKVWLMHHGLIETWGMVEYD